MAPYSLYSALLLTRVHGLCSLCRENVCHLGLIVRVSSSAQAQTAKDVCLSVCLFQSQSIGMNPLYVMVPCTLSASFAFMLPVATPPNAIVFSYGYLKVSDMARTGIVMNIIGILCITLAINSWGRAMFHLDTFPTWANTTGV
ncbi:unnamed protein product [Oncorhynchus mykiss]|uniref:Solute carrier family 13 member 5 n=1 Tax=Oncorhynchus mykiss TaxID=8022 RepID=A0A060Z8L2_ONCMY|nr:unnamed protein product [Oncorhynchus mykiss]